MPETETLSTHHCELLAMSPCIGELNPPVPHLGKILFIQLPACVTHLGAPVVVAVIVEASIDLEVGDGGLEVTCEGLEVVKLVLEI